MPNVARVYDALLGGKENFEADRVQAAKLTGFDPSLPMLVRQNREFVGRVVTWAAARGIRQFIDLGAGLPTHPAVHETAAAAVAGGGARVLYVDNDPVAVLHARTLLARPDGVAAVQADLTEPELVMSAATLGSLIDPAEPVCLLFASVLHFIPAATAGSLIAKYAAMLQAGSVIAVSVFGSDDAGVAERAQRAYTPAQTYTHTRADVAGFLAGAGLEIVEPGVVLAHAWRGDMTDPGLSAVTVSGPVRVLAAVGMRPVSP